MSIRIQNISKSYGSTLALNKVSLSFNHRGVIGLLGPNGAGKTTLMKILTGYLSQWEGTIHVGDADLKLASKKIQRQVGYLPENNPLYPEMYVREYLSYVGDLYALNKAPIDQVIERVGLKNHAHKKIEFLSKGYRQRVGLAAALIHDPQYIILDEPTTGLDPNQVIEIRKLIQTLGKEKLVLLSTHILQEVEAVADQVVILNRGSVVLNEAVEALKKDDEQVVAVSFDYRVESVALQKIPFVKTVVNTSNFDYELTFDQDKDMRPAVFDFAHDNGLKILSLQQKIKGLEKRFNSLTQRG